MILNPQSDQKACFLSNNSAKFGKCSSTLYSLMSCRWLSMTFEAFLQHAKLMRADTDMHTYMHTHLPVWKKNVVADEEVLVGGIPNLPFFARQESYLNHLESMLGQCLAQPFFHQLSWTCIAFVPRPMIRSLVLVTLLQLKAHFQGQQRWTTRGFCWITWWFICWSHWGFLSACLRTSRRRYSRKKAPNKTLKVSWIPTSWIFTFN